MTALISHDRHASEEDNRMDWWLREFGHFPTAKALWAIRWYQEKEQGRRRRRRIDWD